jgi:outer membrane protein assembly factor BamB
MVAGASASAADWPQWRGPQGSGIAEEKNLPVRWSATENIAWKSSLAGLGVSAPVVAGNRVFVTSQVGSGIRRPGPRLAQGADASGSGETALGAGRGPNAQPDGDRTMFVVEAFDRSTGRLAWDYRFEAVGTLPTVHEKHNLASPSPVTDGQMVFAWFGTGQIVAIDTGGKLVWQRHLGQEIAPFEINWGHGSSPTVYKDLLILQCDHPAGASLLAVDKQTGKDRWKVDRGKGRSSYSTPFAVETPTGPELIVNSSVRVDAYDPTTGTFLWHVGGANQFPIPSPTWHNGILYLSRGYRSSPYMAIRPGGRGDVSKSHVVWEMGTGAPYVSSLVYDGGLLYMASDVGAITAMDAETGKRIWQQRVNGVFSASPVAGDGKIYFVSESGVTFVVRSGREPEILATNDLGERVMASPAISNGQLFIRTDDRLICIGAAKK